MRIGAVYPQIELGGDPEAVRRIAVGVEELGYDHLMVFDHVAGADHGGRDPKLWGPYTDRDPFHDPFVMFGHVAALTARIELVTGVLILPQRQTVLVARQAADVDLFSGGRLRLGVGTGWNYVEYDALGQDFATRGAREEEQIDLLRRLWAEPLLDYRGRFDRVDRAAVNPRPARQIPIWLGGFSEPAFRRGAGRADGFVFAGRRDDTVAGWERVRHHLAAAGREEVGFGADHVTTAARSVDDVVTTAERWEAAGGTHLSVVSMRMDLDSAEAHLDFFGQVRDALVRTGAAAG
jgi:probable F420-dependent oxidoreductase